MAGPLYPGYILHADPMWIEYHLANSVGQRFAYTRGAFAPMKNVSHRGHVFFMRLGESRKSLHLWGQFESSNQLTLREAWDRFGTSLGASSFTDWRASFHVIGGLNESDLVQVLLFVNLVVPTLPIPLDAAGVQVIKNATKGWKLGQTEVSAILRFVGVVEAHDLANDDGHGTEEGIRRLQMHYRIERNRTVVDRAKARWLRADPMLHCQCCGMSFAETYGDVGQGYIQAHHRKPLGDLVIGETATTRIADLAPVCPNCHVMLHKANVSVESLREVIANKAGTRRLRD